MAITSLRRTILLNLAEIVPTCAQRLLFVPPVPVNVVEMLSTRPGARAVMAMPDAPEAQAAAPYDAIFFYDGSLAKDLAAACTSVLDQDGFIVLPTPQGPQGEEEVQSWLNQAGLTLYIAFENSLSPQAGYRLTSNGDVFSKICIYARSTYDPLGHAQRLHDLGKPNWAVEVLDLLPMDESVLPESQAALTLKKQSYLEEQFDGADTAERLALLWKGQEMGHYLPPKTLPHLGLFYTRQARMWRKLGVPAHANKLLRDLHLATPEAEVSHEIIEAFRDPSPPQSPAMEIPSWHPGARPLNVLMVTPLFPNYGLDVLYDGLCEVLGDEHVDDYPWKPWLHGETPDIAENYPCTCRRAGAPLDNHALILRLVEGYYDYVLLPDVETSVQFLHPDLVRVILKAARNTPVFVMDQADDFKDHTEYIRRALGFDKLRGYFKREMIVGVDYGPNVYPCPFAYNDWRIPALSDEPRNQDVFWAGSRASLRSIYVNQIEHLLDRKFDRSFNQNEYKEALLDSRIGISLAGAGFDTVRYWELPAHGCLLLSERLPTVIPHDFQDGVSAVFANDAADMAEKLAYYITHPEQAQAIAHAGYHHLKKYHTASVRARQVLAFMQQAG